MPSAAERYVQRNRRQFNSELAGTRSWHLLSAASWAQYKAVDARIRAHARGALLDVGCGTKPHERLLLTLVQRYDTLDVTEAHGSLTYVADVQDMPMVPAAHYDSVLCLEVLEHVPNPERALHEIARVLRPGGVLIMSVPHLSRLHDEPHDYYRYTRYGIIALLRSAGLAVHSLDARGGLFAFLGHQASTALISLTWGVPVIKRLAWYLNILALVYPCLLLDRLFHTTRYFPLGYVVVATKP
ncbi:MAG: class I SAM-dependent methyltransferase [Chloroflexi bacterium]|nr:class I SAM-dependent methyltransferase [Chloroflexota bacterium]